MSDDSHHTFRSPNHDSRDSMDQGLGGLENPAKKIGSEPARRQFIKAGLIGVPMILTFTSRSAWAQAGSGNASLLYGQAEPTDGNPNRVKVRTRRKRRRELD